MEAETAIDGDTGITPTANDLDGQMSESLSFRDLSDKLSDLVADARALEMAITGASTICSAERRALLHFAGKHLDALEEVEAAVDAQYEAEKEGKQ
jgi:hypothetical protein